MNEQTFIIRFFNLFLQKTKKIRKIIFDIFNIFYFLKIVFRSQITVFFLKNKRKKRYYLLFY